MQCDVSLSDAYKNWMNSLAKLAGQQKSDQFWVFRVNNPLSLFLMIKYLFSRKRIFFSGFRISERKFRRVSALDDRLKRAGHPRRRPLRPEAAERYRKL